MNLDVIPDPLKARPQWVCWRRELREGKETKLPYDPKTGALAKVNDASTWTTFPAASAAHAQYDGLGFVLTADDPFTGIDLDRCLDPATGRMDPWALTIVDQLQSYTEISPSGEGVRLFVQGTLPPGRHKKGMPLADRHKAEPPGSKKPGLEFYHSLRYLTCTGDHLDGTPLTIEARHATLQRVYAAHFPAPSVNGTRHRPAQVEADDRTQLDRMFHSKHGAKILALWNGDWSAHPSQSEADSALCFHLAWWFARDAVRMDGLFRQSGLMREKWDARRGGRTYGAEIIAQACAQCRETYTPPRPAQLEEAGADAPGVRGDEGEASLSTAATDVPPETPSETNEHAPHEPLELDCDIGDLDEITRRAWTAIQTGNTPPHLFLYGSAPSRIERDDDTQTLRLVALTPDRLRYHAARLARWTKRKPVPFTKKADWLRVECRPPMDVIFNMLAAPEIALPMLSRIVEVPVFSDRGRLVQRPGYDAEARLYYQPYDAAMTVSVPTDPTAAEVATAKARLDDVLADFPFVSDADKAHAVALAVVPFVRDLIDGPTPLHVAEAACPGSGKNLLVEAVLSPSVGRRIGVIAEARDDDEWRKRLTARLREGYPITLIDNLSRPLDSGTVSAVLTARRWEDRLLGKNETIAVPVRTIFVCTANNPVLSMEIARRAVRIRLDPKMDRPWLRDGFRHPDLYAFVEQERPVLIVALLTLVHAWLKAGRPIPAAKPLGSFEAWSTVVGGIVEHAGYPHFLGNALEFYEAADSEGMLWRLFVSSWWDTYQGQTVSVKELFDIATAIDGFYLGRGSSERGQKTVLGHSLKKHRDQIVDHFRVQEAGTYGSGVQWRLQQIATPVLRSAESVESLPLT